MIGTEGLDFRGPSLVDSVLAGAVMPSSDLTGVDLTGADVYAGDFAGCRFVDATLSRVNLNKSTAVYADFTRATIRGAELRWYGRLSGVTSGRGGTRVVTRKDRGVRPQNKSVN